jgi:hypothetical protein
MMARVGDKIRFDVPSSYPNNIICVDSLNGVVKTGVVVYEYGANAVKIHLDTKCLGCYCCCVDVVLDRTAFKVE